MEAEHLQRNRRAGLPDNEVIRKLEEENDSILKLNDIFQSELKQKTEAFERATKNYAKLKEQYEELLMRLTDLTISNHLSNSSPPTPSPTQSPDSIVSSLESKVERLKEKVRILKEENRNLKEIQQDNSKKQWESAFSTFESIVSHYFPMTPANRSDSCQYLLDSADFISRKCEKYSELSRKYAESKRNVKAITKKCETLAGDVERNGMKFSQIMASYNHGQANSSMQKELSEMEDFILRYRRDCGDGDEPTDI